MDRRKIKTYHELMNEPDGILFCELDYPSQMMFFKTETVEDDIIISPLFDPNGEEEYRYGFRNMDECDKNSLAFYVFDQTDIQKIVTRLV